MIVAAAMVGAGALVAAPAALADTTVSSNWAGYAAHRWGTHFRSLSARWRVPRLTCRPGPPAYASIWVGLGGYGIRSRALEQAGIALDCLRDGRALYSAWYELLPAPAQPVSLPVAAGDLIAASVTLAGHRVNVLLDDLTRHRAFRRSLHAARIDATSAEWIVEAPSACQGPAGCFIEPLADFGAVTLSAARAVNRSGHGGGVSSRWWGTTAIELTPPGQGHFVDAFGGLGGAETSALFADGSAFTVSYRRILIGPGAPAPSLPASSSPLGGQGLAGSGG